MDQQPMSLGHKSVESVCDARHVTGIPAIKCQKNRSCPKNHGISKTVGLEIPKP